MIRDENSTAHGARFYGRYADPARPLASADAGPMPRTQRSYDHRLVRIVQDTGDN